MAWVRGRVLLGVWVVVFAHSAFGGSLKDREQDVAERSAAKTEKKNTAPDTRDDAAHSAF